MAVERETNFCVFRLAFSMARFLAAALVGLGAPEASCKNFNVSLQFRLIGLVLFMSGGQFIF